GLSELAIANRRAGLDRVFKQEEQLLGAIDGFGFAVQLNPPLPRSGFDAQLHLECLEVAQVVVEKLLRETGVFEMGRFSHLFQPPTGGAGQREVSRPIRSTPQAKRSLRL